MHLKLESDVQITIGMTDWLRYHAWCREAKGEMSCLGEVERNGLNFHIAALHILPQDCTSTSTRIRDAALAQFLMERETATPGFSERLKAWLHTHHDFGVFWSGTDTDCIRDFGADSYLISIVINKRGESLARLDLFSPVRATLHTVITPLFTIPESIQAEAKSDVEANVHSTSYAAITPYAGRYYDIPGEYDACPECYTKENDYKLCKKHKKKYSAKTWERSADRCLECHTKATEYKKCARHAAELPEDLRRFDPYSEDAMVGEALIGFDDAPEAADVFPREECSCVITYQNGHPMTEFCESCQGNQGKDVKPLTKKERREAARAPLALPIRRLR